MSVTWTVILKRLASWLAKVEYKRAKAREQKRKDASRMAIKLGLMLLCLAMIQGCRTWDKGFIFAYELVHGAPTDKPMNQEVK